jgi:signal peptidase I
MDRTDPPAPNVAPPEAAPTEPPPVEPLPLTDEAPQLAASPAKEPAAPPETPPPATPPATTPGRRPVNSFRLLLTISAAFVCVFLFLRVFAVEPFGVPTGSMAPTLIGNHREAPCPRCGFPVRVGAAALGDRHSLPTAICPNCGQPGINLAAAPDITGDRLLVDKNVFHLRRPRRWEVAVFRCPDPKEMNKPYVKRVIGLPGEEITVRGGDVYADGGLLRKSLAEAREARILLFDMAHAPNAGWGPRWLVHPPESDPRLPAADGLQPATADETVLHDGELVLDASTPQHQVAVEYRNWDLDGKREHPIRAWNSYDGPPRSFAGQPTAHEFMLECEVEVTAAAPGEVNTLACRLFDGADSVTAEVSVGPRRAGSVHLIHDRNGGLSSAGGVSLEPGRSYKLEFLFVDRRVIFALDGKEVVAPADLPPATRRGEVSRPLQLGARGCKVVVRNLKIYRDIYYTQYGFHGTRQPAKLGPDEYYMLGDNSENSEDSRKWPSPGVPERDFIGKPFLIHQPLRLGRMTVGGQTRVFQTLDWSRLRWLH